MAAIVLGTTSRIRVVADFGGDRFPNYTSEEAINPGQVARINTSTKKATKGNATTDAESKFAYLCVNTEGRAGASGDAVKGLIHGLVDGFTLDSMSIGDAIYISDTDGGIDTAAGTVSKIVGRVVPGPTDQTNDKIALFDFRDTWDIAAESGGETFNGNVTLAGGADLLFVGTTGQNEISLTDNLADALSIKIAGGADFMVFTTTDSGEKIQISQLTELIGGVDLRFTGTTGQSEIQLTDNLADALSIRIGTAGNDFMIFDSTDSDEKLHVAAASGMKLGFFAVTPAVRQSAYTQTYATADKTHANPTAVALTDSTAGTANTTLQAIPDPTDGPATADALRDDLVAVHWPALRNNFADLAASNNAIIVDLADLKQLVNSVIDDLQAYGLLQ